MVLRGFDLRVHSMYSWLLTWPGLKLFPASKEHGVDETLGE